MNKFPKRISKAPKGALVEVVIELNDLQFKTLENKDLLPQVESIAKDMHLTWDVESHEHAKIAVIGINMPWPVDDLAMHNAEMTAVNFMSAIDNLMNDDLAPAQENQESSKEKDVVKKLLEDINLPITDRRHIRGALILDMDSVGLPLIPPSIAWGHLGYNTLKEMCQLYLEKHAKD